MNIPKRHVGGGDILLPYNSKIKCHRGKHITCPDSVQGIACLEFPECIDELIPIVKQICQRALNRTCV